MKKRITAKDLFQIEPPSDVGALGNIRWAFLDQYSLYLIAPSSSTLLHKYSIRDLHCEKYIRIEDLPIRSVTQLQDMTCILYQNSTKISFVGIRTFELQSHIDVINVIISYDFYLVTASDDMTVRLWSIEKGQPREDPIQHILSGHSGAVICLQTYAGYLISSSKDKTVIIWRINAKLDQFSAESVIVAIEACIQSDKLALCGEDGSIYLINMKAFSQTRKLSASRILSCIPSDVAVIREVDDSFLVHKEGNRLSFIEMNLGKIISTKVLAEKGQIKGLVVINRLIVYLRENKFWMIKI